MQLPDWVLMCSARCLDRRESSCDLMGTWVFGSSHFLVRCCSLLPLLLEDQVEPDRFIFLPFLLENQEVDQFCLEREETSKQPPSLPTFTDCCTKFTDVFFFRFGTLLWKLCLKFSFQMFLSSLPFAPGGLEQFSHVSFCPPLEKSC
jgi:hypothetical protein